MQQKGDPTLEPNKDGLYSTIAHDQPIPRATKLTLEFGKMGEQDGLHRISAA